jgi:GT2 family glycosyltransferase
METAVIVSTYNQPRSLRCCLLGLLAQSEQRFHTVVADDGSGPETEAVIRDPLFAPLEIEHHWQLDRGWRKPRILNLALAKVPYDYCIFLDGDCIVRADFVARHLSLRRPRHWVSGTRMHVPAALHTKFADDDILTNRIFEKGYLVGRDPALARYRYRLHPGRLEPLLNFVSYRWRCFHGSNAAAWRENILEVNGFDETFGYGSEDRDLGMRMANAGVRSRFAKFSLCQLHLEHWTNPDRKQVRRNRWRFRKRFFTRTRWVDLGIDTVLERDAIERQSQCETAPMAVCAA